MKHCGHLMVIVIVSMILAADGRAFGSDDDQETSHQLSLADLAGYAAALSGKPTADGARQTDPPFRVKFKDLWNRPDRFRGRRVISRGPGDADLPARTARNLSSRWRKSGLPRRPGTRSA